LHELPKSDSQAASIGLRVFLRQASGSHEVWWNPSNEQFTVIFRHGGRDLPAGTLRMILRQLGIDPAVFYDRRKGK